MLERLPLEPAIVLGGSHILEFLPPVLACAAYLLLYERRLRTLTEERRPPPPWRVIAFVTGVLTMTAVQLPPVDGWADSILFVHMVQHIVIGDIASLLIVLGLTGPILAPLLRIRALRPVRSRRNRCRRSRCGRWTCTHAQAALVRRLGAAWLPRRRAHHRSGARERPHLDAVRAVPGVPLSDERARRAVSAGTGERLRRRMLE